MENSSENHAPWNKGKLVGQKAPLTRQQIWSIRMRLEAAGRPRNLALFNLAIDSKLRACDLLNLKVSDVANGLTVQSRGKIIQQKTGRPVRFELSKRTKESVRAWIEAGDLCGDGFLFPSRQRASGRLSTRQYARLMKECNAPLPPNQEPEGGTAPAGPLETGQHGSLPRDRDR